MVDPGEDPMAAAVREFVEEAAADDVQGSVEAMLGGVGHSVLYQGYVDDPRNTDHAWVMTTVSLWDLGARPVVTLRSAAQQDSAEVGDVKWHPLGDAAGLYASHAVFVKLARMRLGVQ